MRILIANRGEIARRIVRTARRLGHETVAVYADPDTGAAHVRDADIAVALPGSDLPSTYLSADAILAAAAAVDADAVHPGYGFLSEQEAFARAVVDAGLTWIGPHPDAIASMGSKIEARRLAAAADVPTIPGYDESQERADLVAAAERIGYPVLVKASAGGGGRGIRIAEGADDIEEAITAAVDEATLAFGDGRVIVERYITRPRHVEVQVVGDRHGNVVHLGTRECSVQRRYQKLLEEAPAPELPDETRTGLCDAAVSLARSIGYDSAGTVEYVVDDRTGDFFFLEMNTRLQVEHPVTEQVTGLDLVELMVRVAGGEPLPITQDDVEWRGHAFEARITAEDAAAGFRPGTGRIHHLRVPADVRWESAVEEGDEVSPHYDPMIAKLVVDGHDRAAALGALRAALDRTLIDGVPSTVPFHRWLVDQTPVVEGRVTTRFLDETTIPALAAPETARTVAALAVIADRRRRAIDSPWTRGGDRRITPHRRTERVGLADADGDLHEIAFDGGAPPARLVDDRSLRTTVDGVDRTHTVAVATDRVAVVVDAHTAGFDIVDRSTRWAADPSGDAAGGAGLVAPFPGAVAEVRVSAGDEVASGDTLVVLEAMKMLHPLAASGSGTVDRVAVSPGDQVEGGAVLVTFVTDQPGDPA